MFSLAQGAPKFWSSFLQTPHNSDKTPKMFFVFTVHKNLHWHKQKNTHFSKKSAEKKFPIQRGWLCTPGTRVSVSFAPMIKSDPVFAAGATWTFILHLFRGTLDLLGLHGPDLVLGSGTSSGIPWTFSGHHGTKTVFLQSDPWRGPAD